MMVVVNRRVPSIRPLLVELRASPQAVPPVREYLCNEWQEQRERLRDLIFAQRHSIRLNLLHAE